MTAAPTMGRSNFARRRSPATMSPGFTFGPHPETAPQTTTARTTDRTRMLMPPIAALSARSARRGSRLEQAPRQGPQAAILPDANAWSGSSPRFVANDMSNRGPRPR